ncbi:MAG: hypothetical protein JRE23_02650 [Deltaproteobacteria bacterium]|nr:hypothetical protein [Deltaproteobacteria bacterium]
MRDDPQAIINGMTAKNLLLQEQNRELLKLSEAKAQAERTYNIAVATEVLRLKSEGNPVTLIPTLVKGTTTVADLKLKLDIATGVLRACEESLRDIRTAIDCYRSILSWMKEELVKSGIN